MIIQAIKEKINSFSLSDNRYYQLRKDSLFINKEHHQHFIKKGWVKIENVVREIEIDRFMQAYNEITLLDGFEICDAFLNTGCLHNPEIRKKTSDVINENVKTMVPRIFDTNKVEQRAGGSFVVKPPSKNSDLGIHQDSSFIDEENDYGMFIWIPFCDVNKQNGPVSVLSGSHLWGNTQRGFCVPWSLEKHKEILKEHLEEIEVNKGDVLIFDPALIHASTANLSSETRHAITVSVVRKNPQLVYYYKTPEMPQNIIEKYMVDETFFEHYDFSSKPDESKWKKEVINYKPFDISEKELNSLIRKYKNF
jgi:hypothetical protein